MYKHPLLMALIVLLTLTELHVNYRIVAHQVLGDLFSKQGIRRHHIIIVSAQVNARHHIIIVLFETIV